MLRLRLALAIILAVSGGLAGCGNSGESASSSSAASAQGSMSSSPSGGTEAEVQRVMDGYYDALLASDPTACDYLNEAGVEDVESYGGDLPNAATSCEEMVEAWGQIGKLVTDTSRQMTVAVNGSSATVVARFAEPLESQRVTLEREGDDWKISQQRDLAEDGA